jgi:hypothetical protein
MSFEFMKLKQKEIVSFLCFEVQKVNLQMGKYLKRMSFELLELKSTGRLVAELKFGAIQDLS